MAEIRELEVEFSDGGMTDTYYMENYGLCKGLYDEPENVAIARTNDAIVQAIKEDSLKEVVSIKFVDGEVLL